MAGSILYGEIVGPGEPDREKKVRRGFWRTVKRAAGKIPFMEEVVASYYCATDRATPTRVRATLFGALAYFVLPLDAVPDLIAGLGFTDDVTVLLGALTMVRGHILPRHRESARRSLHESDKSAG